jgi:proteasome lid subunit RPN8/RPN11
MTFLDDMIQQAVAGSPQEVCGLVVSRGSKCRLVQAKNLSEQPHLNFDLDPDAWLEVADDEEVIGVYHSHPRGTAHPSMADLTGCEASGLAWHIVNLEGNYTCTQPTGFEAPYLGRPYVHGVHDCFSICRDWYMREWKLDMPNPERGFEWWEKGQNLYLDHLESAGFKVITGQTPEVGDGFLIQVNSPVPNHAAVYIGKGLILHHVQSRLSTQDPYGGMWQKHTTHHLRHVSRMKAPHG